MTRPGSARRLAQALLLATGSLLAVLAGLELLLSAFPPAQTYREWRDASLTYLEDDAVDWRLEPRRYRWGQVNRYGFRGREIPPEKPPGTCRVIVLGGSAAFDLWKRDGETWPDQVEALLGQRLGCRFEVLNAGTPGYSTGQAVRLLESKLLGFKPDLVLVYELYNDSIAFRQGDRAAIAAGWKLNGHANAIGWPAHPNRLLDLVAHVAPRTIDFLRLRLTAEMSRRRLAANARFWHDATLSGQVDPVGFGLYEENLTRMARLLRSHGNVPLGIVAQATILRPDNSPEERQRIHYLYRGLSHDRLWAAYLAAWQVARSVAEREPNAFLVETREQVPPSLELFHDEVHLNALGSGRLALAVADGVVARFAPPELAVLAEGVASGRPEGHPLPPLGCCRFPGGTGASPLPPR